MAWKMWVHGCDFMQKISQRVALSELNSALLEPGVYGLWFVLDDGSLFLWKNGIFITGGFNS
jgi:hypothetical protein